MVREEVPVRLTQHADEERKAAVHIVETELQILGVETRMLSEQLGG